MVWAVDEDCGQSTCIAPQGCINVHAELIANIDQTLHISNDRMTNLGKISQIAFYLNYYFVRVAALPQRDPVLNPPVVPPGIEISHVHYNTLVSVYGVLWDSTLTQHEKTQRIADIIFAKLPVEN